MQHGVQSQTRTRIPSRIPTLACSTCRHNQGDKGAAMDVARMQLRECFPGVAGQDCCHGTVCQKGVGMVAMDMISAVI